MFSSKHYFKMRLRLYEQETKQHYFSLFMVCGGARMTEAAETQPVTRMTTASAVKWGMGADGKQHRAFITASNHNLCPMHPIKIGQAGRTGKAWQGRQEEEDKENDKWGPREEQGNYRRISNLPNFFYHSTPGHPFYCIRWITMRERLHLLCQGVRVCGVSERACSYVFLPCVWNGSSVCLAESLEGDWARQNDNVKIKSACQRGGGLGVGQTDRQAIRPTETNLDVSEFVFCSIFLVVSKCGEVSLSFVNEAVLLSCSTLHNNHTKYN